MSRWSPVLAFLIACASLPLSAQSLASPGAPPAASGHLPDGKVPDRVLLVKGAWSSASDSETALPELGNILDNVYTNRYFGLSFPLPTDWVERSAGPPPSDSGRYTLTLLTPGPSFKGSGGGSILITAQDMFFTPEPLAHPLDLINYAKGHLQADYIAEQEPTRTQIAGRPFISYGYWSPATALHWRVLATEIRCHTVEFVFMNRDPQTLARLVQQAGNMSFRATAFAAGANPADPPVCIRDYATGENVIGRADPSFSEHKFNPVPVRIVVDQEGKVKHIHFLSAFPDQRKAVTEALAHWKLRPYLRDGKPVEVETGIMFGSRAPRLPALPGSAAAIEARQ